MSVKFGVPQGSVTGPLLFLILINDLHCALSANTILFADDTTFQLSGKHPSQLYSAININLECAVQWFRANYLTLHPAKTKYIRFVGKNSHYHEIDLVMGGVKIERIGSDCKTTSFKCIGLMVDDKLNWNDQIVKMKKKN